MLEKDFWLHKSLLEMNDEEWEALCDGCGKCCLNKFIDEEEEDPAKETVHFTNISCYLLNSKTCECSQYQKRMQLVPDCVKLTRENLKNINFMPLSCSYRRLHEGRELPSWHPLLNKGKKSAMHSAGMSVRGKIISEHDVPMVHFEDYIVLWPMADID
ncbi:YcgN family cysteine cluster protein [Aliiglaciecola sp. CAU 1673]|uniref:YcgN family cysteine cluster protein n=1 Tax=Aliiglaciecola sp. CAU 1673 TaxID=3032595 RepID=UPI0023DC0AFD|nr:YcgN family cysteine cluster protein [Aliiglaciecola sp. CAU 1673]MDF2179828.1 YcgN family cysteine cluster protein [Aliiglaciecola sp. CAU 1673]